VNSAVDGECWGGLEELRPALWKYLDRRCRDRSEIDDIVQETFLRAARYRGSLANPDKLRSWLFRIAANVFRDHIRIGGRMGSIELEEDALLAFEERLPAQLESMGESWLDVGDEIVERGVLLDHLGAAFQRLKRVDRLVLASYYAGGESCGRTARDCEISPELVKVRLFRARKRLEQGMRRRFAVARGERRAALR